MNNAAFAVRRSKRVGERHARMPVNGMALLTRGGRSWQTALIDMSATGMSLERPEHWRGVVGMHYHLELLVGAREPLSLEARVVRTTDREIALEYVRIPESMEIPLWEFLGAFADQKEHLY